MDPVLIEWEVKEGKSIPRSILEKIKTCRMLEHNLFVIGGYNKEYGSTKAEMFFLSGSWEIPHHIIKDAREVSIHFYMRLPDGDVEEKLHVIDNPESNYEW